MARSKPSYFVFASSDFSEEKPAALVRATFEDHIKYSMRAILLTRVGERKFHPNHGSQVLDLLFRPFSPELKTELSHRIREALEINEPRIQLHDIVLSKDPQDPSRIQIQVNYQVRATQKVDRMKLNLTA